MRVCAILRPSCLKKDELAEEPCRPKYNEINNEIYNEFTTKLHEFYDEIGATTKFQAGNFGQAPRNLRRILWTIFMHRIHFGAQLSCAPAL